MAHSVNTSSGHWVAPLTPLPPECSCLTGRAQGKCRAVGEPCVWYFPLLWQKEGCTHYKTHEMGNSLDTGGELRGWAAKGNISVHGIIKINFFDRLLLSWPPSVSLPAVSSSCAHRHSSRWWLTVLYPAPTPHTYLSSSHPSGIVHSGQISMSCFHYMTVWVMYLPWLLLFNCLTFCASVKLILSFLCVLFLSSYH